MRSVPSAALLLLLAACGDGGDLPTVRAPGSSEPAVPSAPPPGHRPNAPVPPSPLTEPLTAYGRDPVRVGMDEREALAALGLTVPPATATERENCRVVSPEPNPQRLYVMLEDGRVARVSVYGDSAIRTREGLGVGSTAAQVRAIYGEDLQEAPHEYVAGGRDLTWWASQGSAGLRFETDASGRVTSMHGGGPAIAYSEGCA